MVRLGSWDAPGAGGVRLTAPRRCHMPIQPAWYDLQEQAAVYSALRCPGGRPVERAVLLFVGRASAAAKDVSLAAG